MNRARTHNQIRFMFKFSSFSYRVSLSLFKSYIIDLFLYIYIYIYFFFFLTVHPTRIPDQPARAQIENCPNQHSDGRWQVAAHRTQCLRVGWRFSFPKTRATRPDHKPRNSLRYSKVLRQKHTKSDDV